jgi:hypothetical protein
MMRKQITFIGKTLLATLLITTVVSCSEMELEKRGSLSTGSVAAAGGPVIVLPPPSVNVTQFRSVVSAAIDANFSNTDVYMLKYQSLVYHNYERSIREQTTSFNASTFNIPNFNSYTVGHSIDLSNIKDNGTNVLLSDVPGFSALFSATELSILNQYVNHIYSANDEFDTGYQYNLARNSITSNSSIPYGQKVFMLSILEVMNEHTKKYFAGTWKGTLGTDVENESQSSGSGDCKVSWRQVWLGGVVGGAAGAIAGAKIGLAGGTVAFPGLGTVTGGVGGGVIGFATGYIGGAATSVVTELLSTCFRKTKTMQPDLNCQDFQYYLDHPHCEQELQDHKLWWSTING